MVPLNAHWQQNDSTGASPRPPPHFPPPSYSSNCPCHINNGAFREETDPRSNFCRAVRAESAGHSAVAPTPPMSFPLRHTTRLRGWRERGLEER